MTSLSMRVVEIVKPGGPDVLVAATRPRPEPAADEVLIRVAAAGVNRPDVAQRKGIYPPPPGASDIPGLGVRWQGLVLPAPGCAGGCGFGFVVLARFAGCSALRDRPFGRGPGTLTARPVP